MADQRNRSRCCLREPNLSGRFGGASVIMHMRLSTMLFLFVDVRDVGMFHGRVIVIVGVGGEKVNPVLT